MLSSDVVFLSAGWMDISTWWLSGHENTEVCRRSVLLGNMDDPRPMASCFLVRVLVAHPQPAF